MEKQYNIYTLSCKLVILCSFLFLWLSLSKTGWEGTGKRLVSYLTWQIKNIWRHEQKQWVINFCFMPSIFHMMESLQDFLHNYLAAVVPCNLLWYIHFLRYCYVWNPGHFLAYFSLTKYHKKCFALFALLIKADYNGILLIYVT